MQESTVPILIPFWGKYPEILPVLDVYESRPASENSTEVLPPEEPIRVHDEGNVANEIKMAFLRRTSRHIPVTLLANRLSAWLTKEATCMFLGEQDIEQFKAYATNLAASATEHKLALSYEETLFCQTHHLLPFLPVAEELIEACFKNPLEPSTEIMKDPEVEDEWLLITVRVNGEIDAVLDMYQSFTKEWVSRVPWPERGKIVIDYTII